MRHQRQVNGNYTNRSRGRYPIASVSEPPQTDDLQSVIASACCDIDFSQGASYSGSGETISNLIAAPHDGLAQTDYDFWMGTDGTGAANPTYSTGKITLNGSQWITLKANSALVQNAHKTTGGNPFTIIIAGKFIGPKVNPGAGNGTWGNGGHDPAGHGIAGTNGNFFNDNGNYLLTSGGSYVTTIGPTPATSNAYDNGNHVVAWCYNPATKAYKSYVDSNTPGTGTMGAYTSTTNATQLLQVGACGAGDYPALNGTEIRAVGIINGIISDAEFAAAKALYIARHGAIYP